MSTFPFPYSYVPFMRGELQHHERIRIWHCWQLHVTGPECPVPLSAAEWQP